MDEQKVIIDGTEYDFADLTEQQQYMVAQVKDIDEKLGHLRFQADQLNAAKNAFSDAIVKGITDAQESTQE